jgi:hypothetical protein
MGNMEGEGDESYESGIPIKDIDKIDLCHVNEMEQIIRNPSV